ncbi:MAG: flagellar FlbD family protein, partial [Treponema sp.]|nr:flagellar FlbD family protein [Treponema sp.]
MIEVTRLNGKKYWINPHQIESMEKNPDLTLTLLSGKKVVVMEKPEQVVDK